MFTEYRENKYMLTKREMEICKLLCKGYSNREIALELHIEIITVKSFIKNIADKSGLKNRTQIAIEYFKMVKGKI